jgi:hypothetical protein
MPSPEGGSGLQLAVSGWRRSATQRSHESHRAYRAVGFAKADPIRFEAKRRFEPPKSLPELPSPLTMKSPLGLSFDAGSACIADWPRLNATLAVFNESSDCSGRGQ